MIPPEAEMMDRSEARAPLGVESGEDDDNDDDDDDETRIFFQTRVQRLNQSPAFKPEQAVF